MSTQPAKWTALPLFPLQTVLFPGGSLPLRIFEVRYLDMIGTRHKAGEPFGVVCLSEGSEARRLATGAAEGRPSGDGFAREAFFPVGTLARITKFERPQPGLMMIECVGAQRFRIERSEQLKHGLWIADVELLADDPEMQVPDDLTFTREGLQGLVRHIEQKIDQGGDASLRLPLLEPYRWDDCGWLANRWCELLPLHPELKQRFMSLDSPLLRLELVSDTLRQIGFALPD
ncbi:LON peptidase substrate-binding domain-containing protein [Roseateles amylovorans]|uniref:LON peptidase substrate-binding domain-containing protein n=1 Tax=Roseateles amylovorans TaxID=2978473 RepID=A0ABY6BAB1_9BURK|nr:LON peptidase substrate-binding domain-containing protein [Roseateles amylovorans]UXH80167.1 LON peptidase substrate-binding domain-containing protein [Roseateles amylovorans]